MKQEALNRLLRELDSKRSITVKRAKEIYGTNFSESTWKRLKKALERVHGCKLTWSPKTKSFKVGPTWTLYPTIDPGKRDQLAILRAAAASVGEPLHGQISAFIDKLDRELEDRDPESHAKSPLRQPAPRADKEFFTRLNTIEMAIRRRNVITIGYRKSAGGALEERTIAPYEIYNYAGRFYVWATDEGGSKPKFFALDRIESLISDVDDRFDRDPRLSLDEELRQSFGIWVGAGKPQTIEVEIRENRAADVRARRWPAETACMTLPDGHLRLTFSVTDPREIVAWVLSFGGDAWIRQPAAAAKLAYELAQKAAARHKWAQDVPEDERLMRFDWGVDGLPLERRTAHV